MSEQSASVELVRREASEALERPLPPMSDGEVAAAYRTARALAESGMFKDARQPGQAFAKMLAGRDLGLTPFESMSALHVIEGKIEASADLHATRVRSRDGYDYRVWWLKEEPRINVGEGTPPTITAVAADEEDPGDIREVFGCSIEFLVDGQRRGIGRWTQADTARAGLATKDNHRKYPRSMYFARAMSQGVSQHVPEVMGGLRVYATGELGRGEGGESLTDGASTGDPIAESLPTPVEAVLARARELGHQGLASRESASMALRGRSGEEVARWVATATKVLNGVARGNPPASNEPPESEHPPEAEVVPERCGVEFGAGEDGDPRPARCELPKGHDGQHTGPMVTPTQNEAISGPEGPDATTGTGEAGAAQETPPGAAGADESGEVVDAQPVHAPEHAAEHVAALEQRARDLSAQIDDAKAVDPGSEEVGALNAELDAVETELDAATDSQQGTFGV